MEELKMSNFMDFATDNANAFLMLLDQSTSMKDDADSVREGLKMYRKSFENFSEANSIAVSICRFDDDFYQSEFRHVNNLEYRYRADGCTALYYFLLRFES